MIMNTSTTTTGSTQSDSLHPMVGGTSESVSTTSSGSGSSRNSPSSRRRMGSKQRKRIYASASGSLAPWLMTGALAGATLISLVAKRTVGNVFGTQIVSNVYSKVVAYAATATLAACAGLHMLEWLATTTAASNGEGWSPSRTKRELDKLADEVGCPIGMVIEADRLIFLRKRTPLVIADLRRCLARYAEENKLPKDSCTENWISQLIFHSLTEMPGERAYTGAVARSKIGALFDWLFGGRASSIWTAHRLTGGQVGATTLPSD